MSYKNMDQYAEFYDLIYQDQEDVEFYVSEALKADGKVLEVACGTGRIYLELLEAGVDAYGIDISEAMIEKLEEKADERDLDTDVLQADMQDFDLDEKFSLIIIPFRSFLHNLTINDQLSTLESIYNHLRDDGKLILNFFSPDLDYMQSHYGKEKTIEVENDLGEEFVEKRNDELVDSLNWVIEFNREILRDGEKVWDATGKIKMITKPEFELLLRKSSFSSWKVYGGFELDELEDSEQEMVWFVRK